MKPEPAKRLKTKKAFNEEALRAFGELLERQTVALERQTVALERLAERLDALVELAREAGRP